MGVVVLILSGRGPRCGKADESLESEELENEEPC
jgi:hypothetical protein